MQSVPQKGTLHFMMLDKSVTKLVSESHLDSSFLDTVDTVSDQPETSWMLHIQLNSKSVLFQLDTGVDVTAISPDTHKSIGNFKLTTPQKVLSDPSSAKLNVLGQFESHSPTYKDKQMVQLVFEGLKSKLLGLPAIMALNLVTRLDTVTDTKGELPNKFLSLFSWLGNLSEEYNILLKQDAKPFAIFTPQQVPLPLQAKVQEELNRMKSLGMISPVDQPTPWCAGMVIVPK